MSRLYRKTLLILLALLLIVQSGCVTSRRNAAQERPEAAIEARGGYLLRAAVLYSGSAEDRGVVGKLGYLEQSLVVNLETEAVCCDGARKLDGYDIVYLDESLLNLADRAALVDAVLAFAQRGGGVFCPNAFYDVFPPEFFGASEFTEVEGYPSTLELPGVGADLWPLQELVTDFQGVFERYQNFHALKERSFGVGLVPDTAVSLVNKCDGKTALYALNDYGDGLVFFVNPLLPNGFSSSDFTMEFAEDCDPFANSTAAFNQLIYNDFAALISKRIYGFSISRVYGSFGSPAMSWELHYEDVNAIGKSAIVTFSELCEAAHQPVSLTLVRNPYVWFEQAETMAYALGGSATGLDFALDRYESAYSSGTHIAAGGRWLQLDALQDCASYFTDLPEENYRLYPSLSDYDGDGMLDAFCGSANGKVYYCRGLGFSGLDGRLAFEPPAEIAGVSVAAFSAPQCADLDGDGVRDLLVGAADGKLYLFRGAADGGFSAAGVLLDTGIRGQCLPRVADANGDGVPDLAVGSDQGALKIYYGAAGNHGALSFSTRDAADLSEQCAALELGSWLSPEICDLDGDGVTDLAIGTFSGYIALFSGTGDGYAFREYLSAEDRNYTGSDSLKFGTYCTPVFTDLDGDGPLDLICGYQEYGMAYPIDSAYFPYRDELQKQLDLAREKRWYVGTHYLCGPYHTAEREQWELKTHQAALASYGLTDYKGLNQHTWHLSSLSGSQSMKAIYHAGYLWQSGFESPGAWGQNPESSAENHLALPFFLLDGGERTLLIQNCSTLAHTNESWTDLTGKYRAPALIYYHCDMIYKGTEGAERAIATANAFREKFGYHFVKEDQMMYSIAAAMNLKLKVRALDDGITLTPEPSARNFPLYDRDYQAACGVEIDFAEDCRGLYYTDAAVQHADDGKLYLGLNEPVALSKTKTKEPTLRQVNLPAKITRDGDAITVRFLSDGMMEVVVNGKAKTDTDGWTTTERNGNTVFTRFGDRAELHIFP